MRDQSMSPLHGNGSKPPTQDLIDDAETKGVAAGLPDGGDGCVVEDVVDSNRQGDGTGDAEGDDVAKKFTGLGVVGHNPALNSGVHMSGLGMTMQQFEIDDEASVDYDAEDVKNVASKGG